MDITQMGTVLAIVVITYLIGLAAKAIPGIKDELILFQCSLVRLVAFLVSLECM